MAPGIQRLVGHLGFLQVQPFELLEALERGDPGIVGVRMLKGYLHSIGQLREQLGIGGGEALALFIEEILGDGYVVLLVILGHVQHPPAECFDLGDGGFFIRPRAGSQRQNSESQ